MWLGPAPERPFNPNRFHFNFRWFWDYAGGLMTDWGVHLIDMVLYGMQAVAPKSVLSAGGAFAYPDGGMETPDTQQAVFEYDGFSMIWEHAAGINNGPYGRDHGVAFIGNNGTLVVDRGGWEVLPEVDGNTPKMEAVSKKPVTEPGLDRHTRNFIDCIKSREQPACPPKTAWLAAVNAHLGNVAFKTGRKVYWDQAKGMFTGDDEANALIKSHYRAPWKLPTL
jgi:predicted dehydrogenase